MALAAYVCRQDANRSVILFMTFRTIHCIINKPQKLLLLLVNWPSYFRKWTLVTVNVTVTVTVTDIKKKL
jgi:hypothetical protein